MSSSFFYFDFLMRGRLVNGTYQVQVGEDAEASRAYLYCPIIMNEGLEALQYKTFF
jgi:hypothetical protein